MTLLRLEIHATPDRADTALERIEADPFTMNVSRFVGASIDPIGDVVTCDLPREAVDTMIESLEDSGLTGDDCCITVRTGASHLSDRATRLERQARGSAHDALVWRVIEDDLDEELELSFTFLAFMALATVLATIGVVTNSAILVVGAMVVGPEFGPIARFCVAVVAGQFMLGMRAWWTVAIGFALAIATGVATTVFLRAIGEFPDELVVTGLVQEVASPSWLTLVIALVAGVVGMLSLTSARSATLVGVLISVTTIPAAGDAAALFAYDRSHDAWMALVTLAINLTGIAVAGIATLVVHRRLVRRFNRMPVASSAPSSS